MAAGCLWDEKVKVAGPRGEVAPVAREAVLLVGEARRERVGGRSDEPECETRRAMSAPYGAQKIRRPVFLGAAFPRGFLRHG